LDDKVLHRKSNIEQHEAEGNLGVNSDNNLAVYRKCQIKYEQTKLHITIENKRKSQTELQLCLITTLSCIWDCSNGITTTYAISAYHH